MWQAATRTHGYGQFTLFLDGKQECLCAHRLAYALWHGLTLQQLRDVEVVMHKCDTPLCCNPYHLRAGTPFDNVRDMMRKGRRPISGTPRKLSDDAVREIRATGYSQTLVAQAKRYGVSDLTIKKVIERKTYAEIV